MSEYPGFDEEQGGPFDPSEPRPSEWTAEEVLDVIAEDVVKTIENGGVFDPMDPQNVKEDVERIIDKIEESNNPDPFAEE